MACMAAPLELRPRLRGTAVPRVRAPRGLHDPRVLHDRDRGAGWRSTMPPVAAVRVAESCRPARLWRPPSSALTPFPARVPRPALRTPDAVTHRARVDTPLGVSRR